MSLIARSRFLQPIVRARRFLRGPRRPSWSVEYEAATLLMRMQGPVLRHAPLPYFRSHVEKLLAVDAPPHFRLESTSLGGVPAAWFRHEAERGEDVLLYLHGGGYVVGSIATHRELICHFADAAGCRAVAIDYRLAPEHRCPAQIDDAVAAYLALLDEGVDPTHVVLAGESAGGGLTLSTLVALRDRGVPLPRAAIVISPFADLEVRGDSPRRNADADYIQVDQLDFCAESLVGSGDRRDPRASPIHADLTGLPPLLIQVGGAETLLDGSIDLEVRAREAGVDARLEVYPDMIHVWHFFGPDLPEAADAIGSIARFLESTRVALRAAS